MNNDFEFIIASPFDREKLICEIYYKYEIIAEISQENEELMLEIYPSQKEKWWEIPLVQFQNVLEDAKKHLSGAE
jgi:hypothetical protein